MLVNPAYPEQLVTIGGSLSEECKSQLRILLKKSMDVFAWEPADMTGVPKRIIEHSLNVNPSIEPVAQKRRVLAPDRTQVVIKEVEEWVKAGIVRPIRYPTWIANPVLVKKADGSWRMCIDFKNLNSACPKDYYPLPDIDGKIESVIRRNLEAYVDDMVIKSNDAKMMIADIAEMFDNLRMINMKLNPKKCSFGMEEGKFLGYIVTSEGIRANPKKTKAIADMQSPQTLKGMQSLSGKLAALKRFLSRSSKKSLPFFETLKDITKENKDEYRWTEDTEKAFQEMKQYIVGLPLLTTPIKEETLYVYLAAASELTLNEAERNYAPMEKLALSLLHTSRRLRRYFEAHPIKVLAEAPAGTHPEEFFRLPAGSPNQDEIKRWTLFADDASNNKGSGAGLVLISPSSVEFTYALRLNFTSTDNEAEYEALLAGLRMAKKMKVRDIDAKFDSKLVASQINGNYMASSTSMIKYLATAKECIAGSEALPSKTSPEI
ncbi:reverse transcriptase domain-containing protein [Tanacetum coccineum]